MDRHEPPRREEPDMGARNVEIRMQQRGEAADARGREAVS